MENRRGAYRSQRAVFRALGLGPVLPALAAVAALLAQPVPAVADDPAAPAVAEDKVASLDLCADQVVMALVPRQRIAGLSPWAADPRVSAVAEPARGLPLLSASAESVLTSGAATVVADAYGNGKTLALLRRLGVRVIQIPAADDFPGVLAALDRTAAALGEGERGRAVTDDLQARLGRLAAHRPDPAPLALYLRPDGGTAGDGTSVDAALAAAGYRNLAPLLGRHGWAGLDLETLVQHPPAVIVTSFFDDRPASLHGAFARHPAFRALLARTRVVNVPGRLWSCGGWPLVEAAEILAAAREDTP